MHPFPETSFTFHEAVNCSDSEEEAVEWLIQADEAFSEDEDAETVSARRRLIEGV